MRNGGTVVLQVPAGKFFSLEYIAAYGQPSCTIDPDSIVIDGITISGGSNYNQDLVHQHGRPNVARQRGLQPH